MAPIDIDSLNSQRTWTWLLDVPRRLNVAVEVLGSTGGPLLPTSPASAGRLLRDLVTHDDSFRSMIDCTRQSGRPQFAAFSSLQVACIPVESAGILVLGRETGRDIESEHCRRELDQIGAWLAAVIQDAAAKPPHELSVEPYRIASLERILGEAAARGSARSVLGAFVEAFAVWDDIRVVAYSVTVGGRFVRFVSPVGGPAAAGPPTIDGGAFGSGELVRLPPEEAQHLQLRGSIDDVLVQQLTSGDRVHWLLVFCGQIPAAQEVRIALYSAILRETLNHALARTTVRTDGPINRRPMPGPDEPLEPVAEALASNLKLLVDAQSCALAIRMKRGRQILAVGRMELLPPSDAKSMSNRLTVTTFDDDSLMAFVACRDQLEFTTVDYTIAEKAAGEVHRWLRAALDRSTQFERRRRSQPTEATFEALACEAVRQGQHVSLAVVSLGTSLVRPGTMQSCVANVRDQIRSCDFAAALNDSEIVVLLSETTRAQADTVAARLAALLQSGPDGTSLHPATGLATVAPGDEMPASMIRAARTNLSAVA